MIIDDIYIDDTYIDDTYIDDRYMQMKDIQYRRKKNFFGLLKKIFIFFWKKMLFYI
jgi:hypothetical protein